MKNTQRLFALLLAVVMVLSMAVVANAAETTDPVRAAGATSTGTAYITIEGARAGTYYEVYRLFDVDVVTSTGEPIYKVRQYTRGEDETNKKYWDTFITENSGEGKIFTVSADGIHVKAMAVSDAEAQEFAEDVFEYADTNTIPADIYVPLVHSGRHVSPDPRPYGFYVMRSFTIIDGVRTYSPKANVFTLPAESDHGPVGVTITEKNDSTHFIKKEVREDSLKKPEDDSIGWVESNVAEIDQEVEFKITVDLAPGTGTYTIVDNMEHFELVTIPTVTHSVQLKDGVEYRYEEIKEGNIVTGFRIVLNDSFRTSVTDIDTLTIRYTAKLMSNATVAGEGTATPAELWHQEKDAVPAVDPVSEDATITHTCQIQAIKVDETEQNPLAGAKFQLLREDGKPLKFTKTGNLYVIDHEAATVDAQGNQIDPTMIITDDTGIFNISGLDTMDKYTLVEKEAPANYVKMDNIEIVISGDNLVKSIKVVNLPGVDMPTTGGMGTTIIYAVGGLMVLAAVVLLVTKKRMAV